MRVKIAHDVADDLRRFLEGRTRVEPQQPHAVEDAPMHRLEPVARIRQRAVHDGRERIREIALFQRLAQRNIRAARPAAGESVACPWRLDTAGDGPEQHARRLFAKTGERGLKLAFAVKMNAA